MLYESLSQNSVFLVVFLAMIVGVDILIILYIRNRMKANKGITGGSAENKVIAEAFYNSESPLVVHSIKPNDKLKIVDCNKSAVKLFNETPLGNILDDYLELADPAIAITEYISSLNLDHPVRFLVALKSDKMRSLDYEIAIHAIVDSDIAVAYMRDIKEEKELINNYKDSQYALNLAMENGKIAVFEYNVKSERIKCDQIWFKLHGLEYKADGMVFDDFLRIIQTDDVKNIISLRKGFLDCDYSESSLEYKVLCDGSWVWRKVTVKTKFKDKEGHPTVLIGVSIDIDAEKKLNVKLNSLSRNFQFLLDYSPDYIYFKDNNYKFTMVSKSMEENYRLAGKSTIVGLSDFDVHTFEDANTFFELDKKVIENGERIVNYEQVSSMVNGKNYWMLSTKIPVKNKAGEVTGLFGISKDITEYKQLSIELSNNQRLRSISRLAGGIAHDFNNSLNGIMGFAYLLEGMFEKDSKENEYVQHIIGSTEKCAELTRHLLAFARRGKYEVKVVDLHNIIRHAISILEHSLSKHVNVVLELEAENPIIKADESQIENVIINIANNADSAMDGEGVLLIKTKNSNISRSDSIASSTSSRFRKKDIGKCVVIEFTDTGVGIEDDIIERVFEPFFTTKPLGKGTGLGLAAVYGIIENHDGLVGVDSKVGIGTTVRVCLPAISNTNTKSEGK